MDIDKEMHVWAQLVWAHLKKKEKGGGALYFNLRRRLRLKGKAAMGPFDVLTLFYGRFQPYM